MTDAELRDLIERAYQIGELQKTAGWLYLLDETERRLDAKKHEILNGQLDHDEYIRACGFLQGAAHVINAADQLNARIARERDRKKTA